MNYCQSYCRTIQRLCNSAAPLLPPEYQQVEYLQSDGAQWINTGYVINTLYNIEYEIKYYPTDIISGNYGRVCGAHNSTGYDSCVIWDNGKIEHGSVQQQVINAAINTMYTASIVTDTTDYTYTINNTVTSGTIAGNPSSQRFCIFTLGRSPLDSRNRCKARVYRCKLNVNSAPAFDFIPCYRVSDNKPGFYDLVTNTFFVNSGSGADFTVGNNV